MGVRRGEGGAGGGGSGEVAKMSLRTLCARGAKFGGGGGSRRGGVATPIDHSETGVMSVSPGGGWGVYLPKPVRGLRGPPPGTRNFVKFG